MRFYDFLTYSLINQYGNRKKPGRLSILVNVEEKKIYAVPRKIEHIDYAKQFNIELSKLIPVHIDTKLNENGLEEIIGLVTGVSGMEIGYGIRHSKKDLEEAHKLAKDFIENGELPIKKLEEDKIIYKYSTNQ
ncbi:hypothetical protein DRJ22_00060 [Candidatus Woesearchaeota archaeon]|nr:MAG: hypothetical protein B6U93_01425 [Candidatus Woesearchaeota archaeon ex4484_78]RLE47104.1 MAG: hypothetical protein DRJ22_00060 [Candidatus Woesearchaeota archaeon]